jgi:hypothetical protein
MKLNEVDEMREISFLIFVHYCTHYITYAKNMHSQRKFCLIYEKKIPCIMQQEKILKYCYLFHYPLQLQFLAEEASVTRSTEEVSK